MYTSIPPGNFIDIFPESILLCDAGGTIRRCNSLVFPLLGYTQAELIGMPFSLLVAECSRQLFQANLEKILNRQESSVMDAGMALIAHSKNGNRLSLDANFGFLPGNTESGVVHDMVIICLRDESAESSKVESKIEEPGKAGLLESLNANYLSANILVHDFTGTLSFLVSQLNGLNGEVESIKGSIYWDSVCLAMESLAEINSRALQCLEGKVAHPVVQDINGIVSRVYDGLKSVPDQYAPMNLLSTNISLPCYVNDMHMEKIVTDIVSWSEKVTHEETGAYRPGTREVNLAMGSVKKRKRVTQTGLSETLSEEKLYHYVRIFDVKQSCDNHEAFCGSMNSLPVDVTKRHHKGASVVKELVELNDGIMEVNVMPASGVDVTVYFPSSCDLTEELDHELNDRLLQVRNSEEWYGELIEHYLCNSSRDDLAG